MIRVLTPAECQDHRERLALALIAWLRDLAYVTHVAEAAERERCAAVCEAVAADAARMASLVEDRRHSDPTERYRVMALASAQCAKSIRRTT
jgi:hypothetical protein